MKNYTHRAIINRDYNNPLPCLIKPLWWQNKGLQYTATGYGSKIPTEYLIRHNNRLKRVYCHMSNHAVIC